MEHSGRGFKSKWGQLSIATSQKPSVVNSICISSFPCSHVITCARFRLNQMWRLTKTMSRINGEHWKKKKWNWSSCTKLSVVQSCGFKSHSDQLSMATSQNDSVLSTIRISSLCCTHVITCARFHLKRMWQLTKAMAEMKRERWTKRWNLISCTKLALSARWAHGLVAQSVRASEWNSVVLGSNPSQANFL